MVAARTWLLERWTTHPRIALALRAAVAAAIAWTLVGFLPGVADDYPYYAPFGAIIATTFTLAGSVRESLQAVGSIVVGGSIAWIVDSITGDVAPVTVGIVVALSVSVAGWKVLGAMGGWAPTAAVFTLIIGHGEAFFIGAYGGLTLFGALIGILINMAVPPLPLAPARVAVGMTRGVLAGQLRELAALTIARELPTLEQWHRDHNELTVARAEMQGLVARVRESLTGNARAKNFRDSLQQLTHEADSLDRVSLLVTDVSDLLLLPKGAPDDPGSLPDRVREPIARALNRVADALEAYGLGRTIDPTLEAADAELRTLLETEADETRDQLVVHSVVLSLRRALDTFE